MPKLEIIDDILAPKDTITIRFQGKNPVVTALMVPRMLIDVLKVSAKDVLETDIKWDTNPSSGGEMRDFYGRWAGKRAEDKWTETRVRIIIQGAQHAKERTGWVRIELKGTINTKYKYFMFIQRSFWWFYNLIFYHKQRRAYIEQGKDFLYTMRDIFQRTLGISPEE